MNRQKLFRLLATAAGLAVIAIWATCFVLVNRAYPQTELIRVGLNEPVQYGPYTITVSGAYIGDTIALYKENGLSAEKKTLPEKTLVCTLTVGRTILDSDDPAQTALNLWHIAVASGAWSSMADTGELYTALNQGAAAPGQLPVGGQQTYRLPFGLWRGSFSQAGWGHLDERPFTLQLSLYPEKREIQLSGYAL